MAERKTKTKPVKAGKKTKEETPANTPIETPAGEPETEIPTEVTNLVDELVNELKKAEETEPTPGRDTVSPSEKSNTNHVQTSPPTDDINKKRSDLIKLSEDGEVTQSVSYIRKASAKVVDKLYAEYEARRMERANEFLTDMLISRFSNVLGGLDAVESSEALDTELQKDKLLKSDVGKVVAMVTPYLPCLGLLSGGMTVGKHMYQHKTKVVDEKLEN